jgi:hypothetical protein
MRKGTTFLAVGHIIQKNCILQQQVWHTPALCLLRAPVGSDRASAQVLIGAIMLHNI